MIRHPHAAKRLRPGALRRSAIEPAQRVAASPAQRLRVAGAECVVCGRTPVDPAHLVPQRLGGCRAPECVIPLCRTHHRLFDCGRLALGLYLAPNLDSELGHALTHVSEGELAAALVRGWPAPWEIDEKEE